MVQFFFVLKKFSLFIATIFYRRVKTRFVLFYCFLFSYDSSVLFLNVCYTSLSNAIIAFYKNLFRNISSEEGVEEAEEDTRWWLHSFFFFWPSRMIHNVVSTSVCGQLITNGSFFSSSCLTRFILCELLFCTPLIYKYICYEMNRIFKEINEIWRGNSTWRKLVTFLRWSMIVSLRKFSEFLRQVNKFFFMVNFIFNYGSQITSKKNRQITHEIQFCSWSS